MATLLDHVEYLSKEIGARPAGTEEEQQAALYIADQLQKEASFSAAIEEFTSSSNIEGARAIPAVVTFVVTILAMIFNVLTIPAFILALIAAVVYTLEAFDRPVVSKVLARGASQNVVAKYQPGGEASSTSTRGRSRKIILVAHYDSGKVTPPIIKKIDSLGWPIALITVGAMAFMVLLLLIRIFIGANGGAGTIVLNAFTVVGLIVCALPILRAVMNRVAPYNEGANNNAAGVAALIEVARRISRGSVSEADLAAKDEGVTIHGERAAIESGLVPEGAQIRYEAEHLQPPEEIGAYDEEERLLSAKAAIAAITGKPVERHVYGSVASKLVNSRVEGDEAVGVAEPAIQPEVAQAPEAAPAPAVEAVRAEPVAAPAPVEEVAAEAPDEAVGFSNAPSWFIAAQQKAKKPASDASTVQRSRYTEAFESAQQEAEQREQERLAEEQAQREQERAAREEEARASIRAAQQGVAAVREEAPAQAVEAPVAEEPAEALVVEEPAVAPAAEKTVAMPVIAEPAEAPIAAEPEPHDSAVQPTDGRGADPASTTFQAPITLSPEELAAALADDEPEEPKSRLSRLPLIDSKTTVPETTSPSRSGLFRMLRSDVPSLSGVIRMQEAGEDVSQKPVQRHAADQRPQFAVPEVESMPEPAEKPEAVDYDMEVPVPENLAVAAEEVPAPAVQEEEPRVMVREEPRHATRERRHVADEQPVTHTEEDFSEPNEVNMPSSRSKGFFSRFRRNKDKDEMDTPQEWLDVDKDFDARSVGRKRGSWESFRDDDQYDDFDDFGNGDSKRRWNGGAFSRVRLGHVSTLSGEDAEGDIPDEPVETLESHTLTGEIERIYHFRNPQYNTEIWFAAIGSDTELHDGARAFIEAHRDDLRGAMVIEIESLGAGALSTVTEEGKFRKVKASSRVKRYTRKATAATGIALDEVKLLGSDSITTTVQKAGYQAMHLVGAEDEGCALKGSADDVLENVDELTLDDNVNFLMELLKRN